MDCKVGADRRVCIDRSKTIATPMSQEPTPWKDAAKLAFDEATRLFQDGDYAGALGLHEWFHDHALEFNPGYYGVRLSFALSQWKELADVYPPAMTALVRIRDRDCQRLLSGAGSPELIHDVASIDRCLGQDDATLELFRKVEAAHPELAKESFRFIDRLVLRRDAALFCRYCGDPVGFYSEERELFLRLAASLRECGRGDPERLLPMREELRQVASRLAEVYLDDSEVAARIARLESSTDEELTRRAS